MPTSQVIDYEHSQGNLPCDVPYDRELPVRSHDVSVEETSSPPIDEAQQQPDSITQSSLVDNVQIFEAGRDEETIKESNLLRTATYADGKMPASTQETSNQEATLVNHSPARSLLQDLVLSDQRNKVILKRTQLIERNTYARHLSSDVEHMIDELLLELQTVSSSELLRVASSLENKATELRESLLALRMGLKRVERGHENVRDAEQQLNELAEDIYGDNKPYSDFVSESEGTNLSDLDSIPPPPEDIDIFNDNDQGQGAGVTDAISILVTDEPSSKHNLPRDIENNHVGLAIRALTSYSATPLVQDDVGLQDVRSTKHFEAILSRCDDAIKACGAQFDMDQNQITDVKEPNSRSDMVVCKHHKHSSIGSIGFVTSLFVGRPGYGTFFALNRTFNTHSLSSDQTFGPFNYVLKDIQYRDLDQLLPGRTSNIFETRKKKEQAVASTTARVYNWLSNPNFEVFIKSRMLFPVTSLGGRSAQHFSIISEMSVNSEGTKDSDTKTRHSGVAERFDQRSSSASVLASSSNASELKAHTVDCKEEPQLRDIHPDTRDRPPPFERSHSWPRFTGDFTQQL